jgi:cell division inhibitor SepF
MASVWRKTLVYLGLVEDDELDDYLYEEVEQEEPQQRRVGARRGAPQPAAVGARDGYGEAPRPSAGGAVVRPMPTQAQARFHLVHPTTFNDAQEVGDRFRQGFSVLLNLQTTESDLARRLVDFASGLAYGLGGSLQPVAEKTFLLTPAGVQVSAEERRRFLEERGFFNQA